MRPTLNTVLLSFAVIACPRLTAQDRSCSTVMSTPAASITFLEEQKDTRQSPCISSVIKHLGQAHDVAAVHILAGGQPLRFLQRWGPRSSVTGFSGLKELHCGWVQPSATLLRQAHGKVDLHASQSGDARVDARAGASAGAVAVEQLSKLCLRRSGRDAHQSVGRDSYENPDAVCMSPHLCKKTQRWATRPISSASMVPQENVNNNGWVNIGPNAVMASEFTNSDGTYDDAPLGICASSTFSTNVTQAVQISVSNTGYSVRTNNLTITGSSAGHGSITNGSDISQTR